ncbi:SDR family NAD(P)-dependent oxidoreductase, partial [Streptomyces asiaticus]
MPSDTPTTVLVTGASSGFGALTARALARVGHTVYAGIRQPATRNAAAVAELTRYATDHDVDLRAVELDVTSQDSADAAIARILADRNRLDVIVHNAGHMATGPAEAFTPEQLAQLYDVNVLGTQRVNRAALPRLRAQGEGLLVWIGSSSTRGGCPPFIGPYFAAKAAMDALAVSYAAEVVRFGIDTAIVVPGAFTSGTNHFRHAGAPADSDRATAYDERYAPFGAMAPLKPVQDDRSRVIRQTDWPLTGGELTAARIVYDTAVKAPVKAEFQHIETGTSWQRSENLPQTAEFELGPGRVQLSTRVGQDHDLGWLRGRPTDSQEPGVTATLLPGLPALTLFVSRPAEDGRVHVVVDDGEPKQWMLSRGEPVKQIGYGAYELTLRFTPGSEPPAVEIGIATVPEPTNRYVLPLDSVQDSITVGSWVAVERPRKGSGEPDGIPGDRNLASVTTRVVAVRTAAYTNYGITGRGTRLTLADPWLDEHDVLLSAIRDTTVHAGGEPLRPADEPLGEDVHGNEIELAELYDGLRPGRRIVVSGERTDIP